MSLGTLHTEQSSSIAVAEVGLSWGGPWAFHPEGALGEQLKLKWVQAWVSKGAHCRVYPGRVIGAKASMDWGVLRHSMKGQLSRVIGDERGMSQEVPKCSVLGVKWCRS